MIDSHAHLSSSAILPQIDLVLERAKAAGLEYVVNICTDPKTLEEGLLLEKRCPWIRNAGATTPHDVEKEGESCFEIFVEAARADLLVAIGETGLDYFYEHSNRKLQQQFLIRYLHLATQCKLPVIFHCRDAFPDLFTIVDREYPKKAPALLHCFTGTEDEAWQGVERGWMISFSGILTFKKSEALREVAKTVPLEHLLIETDSPYLAPQSKRGQSNEPSFIGETAARLAVLKGIAPSEMARITSENAKNFFKF